ncbi:MAG: tRNA threonylcarbamoyladenosine dehydratase, partial [Christensenellales bacterium]
SMGTGNKTDPTAFEIKDVFDTNNCALAKVMRKELKAHGIKRLTTVCSRQLSVRRQAQEGERKPTPSSVAWCPSVAGMIIASKVVYDLTTPNNKNQHE